MYKTKSHIKFYLSNSLLFLFTIAFILSGCGVDGDDPDNGDPGNGAEFTGESETYELQSTEVSGVSGVAIFEELTDGSTLITLELNGTEANAEHPAHIHANSAAEGGGIDVSLNAVDGSSGTGSSETTVTSLDDGTSISYNELISYDGHIMVHLSEDELATVISRGDIGGNAFTGASTMYELHEASDPGISGEVRFEERNNGNTLVTIELMGTSTDGDHPAHIHDNSVAEGGGVAVPLNNVDGESGLSLTNIRADETAPGNLTYSALLEFDGHVNVHLSGDDIATLIAQGDIGGNALTGTSTSYELLEANDSGFSGSVHFEERNNGNTLVTIELMGTSAEGDHPAHIHDNSVAEGGGIAVPLNNVDGETGLSITNIRADETGPGDLTYTALLDFDGHVNVHLSDDDFAVIAQGDIGANYGEEAGNGNGGGDGINDGNGDNGGNGDDY